MNRKNIVLSVILSVVSITALLYSVTNRSNESQARDQVSSQYIPATGIQAASPAATTSSEYPPEFELFWGPDEFAVDGFRQGFEATARFKLNEAQMSWVRNEFMPEIKSKVYAKYNAEGPNYGAVMKFAKTYSEENKLRIATEVMSRCDASQSRTKPSGFVDWLVGS